MNNDIPMTEQHPRTLGAAASPVLMPRVDDASPPPPPGASVAALAAEVARAEAAEEALEAQILRPRLQLFQIDATHVGVSFGQIELLNGVVNSADTYLQIIPTIGGSPLDNGSPPPLLITTSCFIFMVIDLAGGVAGAPIATIIASNSTPTRDYPAQEYDYTVLGSVLFAGGVITGFTAFKNTLNDVVAFYDANTRRLVYLAQP